LAEDSSTASSWRGNRPVRVSGAISRLGTEMLAARSRWDTASSRRTSIVVDPDKRPRVLFDHPSNSEERVSLNTKGLLRPLCIAVML
jgi:hypothetical protein